MSIVESVAERAESREKGVEGFPLDAFLGQIRDQLLLFAFRCDVRQVFRTTADRRIGRTATWRGVLSSPVDAAGREAFTMNRLYKDPSDLLRKRPVLESGTASKRFLQLIGDIRTDEYTFTVCHKVGNSFSS